MAPHIEHSLGFRDAWQTFRNTPPASLIDLGSGGGIPGLVLAELVKSNDLQAKPEQIRAEVDEFAKSYEDPKEVVRWYYSNQQRP